MAADAHGHVYILYPDMERCDCPACTAPTIALLISDDNGTRGSRQKRCSLPPTGSLIRRLWWIRRTGKRSTRRGCRTTNGTSSWPGRSISGDLVILGRSAGRKNRQAGADGARRGCLRRVQPRREIFRGGVARCRADVQRGRSESQHGAGMVAGRWCHDGSLRQRLLWLDGIRERNATRPVSMYISRSADRRRRGIRCCWMTRARLRSARPQDARPDSWARRLGWLRTRLARFMRCGTPAE